MHETMIRLYEVAESKDIFGQSDLASRLNLSPQVINNWEARGMSKSGILTASRLLNVNAIWLATGKGLKEALASHPLDVYKETFNNLSDSDKDFLIAILDALKMKIKTI